MSDAERMRKVRLHKKGDHSMCTAKCAVVRDEAAAAIMASAAPEIPMVPETAPREGAGAIEAAVQAYVNALPYKTPDPRALLCLIAVQLAKRVDETAAVPAAVRELRVLLMQLTEQPNGPAGPVDEIRLRAAQRALDSIIARAA